jgi:hypothetical protein
MTERSWRGVAAVAGLLGLLALVAFAAAGHAPAGGTSRPSASTPAVVKDYIGTIALIMLPVGACVIFWAAFLKRAYKDVPLKTSSAFPFQVAPRPVTGVVAVFIVLALLVHFGHGESSQSGDQGDRTILPGLQSKSQDQYEPHVQWLPVLVLGSLVTGIAGAMVLMTYQRRRNYEDPDAMRVTVAEVLEETLDDLVREPDPRTAVIGAYARMERTLAARGYPREEHEAPGEYLARILEVVGASGHSVRRITKLFERARFSEHDIDEAMKEDAIESLAGLRAELLVAA